MNLQTYNEHIEEAKKEAQKKILGRVYTEFRSNCIVIDLDGSTQVITEDKLIDILIDLKEEKW